MTLQQQFLKQVNSRWRMQLYFFKKLPTLWWWGVRVEEITLTHGRISLPYGRRTQNPFFSTYFAAQAGAAELSTGLLGMARLQGQPPVSMLVTQIKGTYTKKAAGRITFTCMDGAAIVTAIERAIAEKVPQEITAISIGTLADGTEVSRHEITWSFKAK